MPAVAWNEVDAAGYRCYAVGRDIPGKKPYSCGNSPSTQMEPSFRTSFFQMGTVCLIRSRMNSQPAKAS